MFPNRHQDQRPLRSRGRLPFYPEDSDSELSIQDDGLSSSYDDDNDEDDMPPNLNRHRRRGLPPSSEPIEVLSKRPKLLGRLLYEDTKTQQSHLLPGSTTDLTILIGPGDGPEERIKLSGHKAVFSAMSAVFATQLNSSCWNVQGDPEQQQQQTGQKIIELPQDVGESSARAFIKYLYTEDLDHDYIDDNEDVLLLEVMALADMYLVKELRELCDEFLSSQINIVNCVDIYEKTKRFGAVTKVGTKAYNYLKKRIKIVISEMVGKDDCNWDVDTWRTLLQEDYLIVNEIDLFKALLMWWKGNEESRLDALKELVMLIRYPLMSPSDFAKFVAPSQALCSEDVIQIFMRFNGDGSEQTRFNSNTRRRRSAPSSHQLIKLLKEAKTEDVIILCDMTYVGHFELKMSYVTIKGCTNSILKSDSLLFSAISVEANHCKLENISLLATVNNRKPTIFVKGSYNSLTNVTIGLESFPAGRIVEENTVAKSTGSPHPLPVYLHSDSDDDEDLSPFIDTFTADAKINHYIGCLVEGTDNELSFFHISSHSKGIYLNGNNNKLSKVDIKDCDVGIFVSQNKNQLEFITLKEVKTGIDLQGHGNRIQTAHFIYSKAHPSTSAADVISNTVEKIRAVSIMGHDHFVQDVVCEGLEANSQRWSIYITVCTSRALVQRCGPGQVTVRGQNNRIRNVKASLALNVAGSGHVFHGCEAQSLVISGLGNSCSFVDCNFIDESSLPLPPPP